jgi:photosystem II stability/assembly factor-like uncharacterized protein
MRWRPTAVALPQVYHALLRTIAAVMLLAGGCIAAGLFPGSALAATCVWTPLVSGSGSPLNGVTFLDGETGWAAGLGIFHTDDGGATWRSQPTGMIEDFNAISFVDEDYGWAVGQDATILHTTDGGASWQRQHSDAIYPLYDVFFIDRDVGWAVGFKDVLHTTDGGTTWSAQRSLWTSSPIRAVTFADARNGWAAGSGGIMRTTNGGATWIRTWGTSGSIYDLSFVDATSGWAVGVEGKIYRTSDAGENWARQESDTDGILYGVSFVDSRHGWVCKAGAVLGTEDAGQTWTTEVLDTRDALFAIDAVDLANAWVVGYGGTILRRHPIAWDAPVVTLSGIPVGWQAPPVSLIAAASVDPVLTLGRLEVSLDGGATWVEAPGSGAERELILTANGRSTVAVRAVDSRGEAATESASVLIDAARPTSRPTSLTRSRQRIAATGRVPVRIAASDVSPGSGVAAVSVRVVTRSGKVVGRALLLWTGGGVARVSVKVPRRLPRGRYVIRSSAIDGVGNAQGPSGRAILKVD